MRAWHAAVLCLLTAPVFSAQEPRSLTPEAMQADLFLLTEQLSSLHAGLQRYASADEIEQCFGAAALAVEERPREVLWFYRQVSELVAHIRCGHTEVQLGARDRAAALTRRGLLPCEVLLSGSRVWIRRVLDDAAALRPGQELLALDGVAMGDVVQRAFARMADDGFIETGKERNLELDFAQGYALLVDEARSGAYTLQLAGASEPVLVRGLAPDVFAARRGAATSRALVKLELRPDEGVGILSVSQFGDRAGEAPFPEQLEASFRKLREQKIPHLVLDLRGNGGGRDLYGARLVSYLSAKPFGYFERIEVTPEYQGRVKIEERDGRRLMLSHPGLEVQPPAELHFEGEVAILIDGFTFSTAADVAAVAHANHLATFFGEETGGGYEGNNSGDSLALLLPNSGLALSVPEWNYTTANVGTEHHGRGVVPDVELHASIEDALAGRDVVLERALADLKTSAR